MSAQHTPGPTRHQVEWLKAIASGKVRFDGRKHMLMGYEGNPRKSNYLMVNALREGGWIEFSAFPIDQFSIYTVTLTEAGRAAVAKATGGAA